MKRLVLQVNLPVKPGEEGYEDNRVYLTSAGMYSRSIFSTEDEFMRMLYWLIVAKKHKAITEIGTNKGDFTYWLLKAAGEIDGHVVTVDEKDIYENIESERLTRIIKSSADYWNSVPTGIKSDFIYVDGDHSFIGAYADMVNAEARINKGGTIAVHDIGGDLNEDYMVKNAFLRFMSETKGRWMLYNCGAGLAIGEF